MLKYLGVYLAIFVAMVVIDMVWLRLIAVQWYADGMGPLLTDSPNLWAAAAFYLMFPAGLFIFAVFPSAGAPLGKAVTMMLAYGDADLMRTAPSVKSLSWAKPTTPLVPGVSIVK